MRVPRPSLLAPSGPVTAHPGARPDSALEEPADGLVAQVVERQPFDPGRRTIPRENLTDGIRPHVPHSLIRSRSPTLKSGF